MKILSALLIVGIAFFSSCQKEYDPLATDPLIPDSTVINPPAADSNYLWKLHLKYSESGGEVITTFKYDSVKRVTAMIDSEVVNGTIQFLSRQEFYYNGSDTLPFAASQLYDDGNTNLDTMHSYYTYDVQGRILLDSSINISNPEDTGLWYERIRIETAYNGTQIIRHRSSVYDGHETEDDISIDTAIIANANLTSSSYYHFYTFNSQYNLDSRNVLMYDSHPSAFSKLNIRQVLYSVDLGEGNPIFPSKNNISSLQYVYYVGNETRSVNYTIQYNSSGYPILFAGVATPASSPGSVPLINNITFTYRSL